MRVLKLLLILSVMFMTLPVHASDETSPERVEPQKDQSPSDPVERPQRAAVKLSPGIRVLPRRPDESDRRRRLAPAEADSPLQDVPALKDVLPPDVGVTPVNR